MENWDSGCDSKAQDQAPSLPHPWHMLQRADPLLGQVHSSQAFAPTIPLPGNPLFTSQLMEVNALASPGSFQSSLLAALFSHALCCSRNLSLFFLWVLGLFPFLLAEGFPSRKEVLCPPCLKPSACPSHCSHSRKNCWIEPIRFVRVFLRGSYRSTPTLILNAPPTRVLFEASRGWSELADEC